MPTGSVIFLEAGTTPPAGYTFLGSFDQNVRGVNGKHSGPVTFNMYRKD